MKTDTRDWKKASEECLVIALNKASECALDGATEKLKALESLIKTVGDIVGTGLYLSRASKRAEQGAPDDED